MKEVSVHDLEAAVSALASEGEFTCADVFAKLKIRKSNAAEERVEQVLSGDEELFSRDGVYLAKAKFFHGKQFVVVPSDEEIEEGILFAGHRFAPFCAPDIFPSEIRLTEKKGKPLPFKEVRCDLQKVFHCHLLLGAEHISDYLIAEHPENQSLAQAARSNRKLTLSAADLKTFYRKHDFSDGDALLCTVLDYAAGSFQLEYLSGKERKDSAITASVVALADALGLVVDRFRNYLDMPVALGWAYFIGDESRLFGAAAAGLEEFSSRNETIDIAFDNGMTSFIRKQEPEAEEESEEEHHHEHEECHCRHDHRENGVPFQISGGDTCSLGAILKEIGCPVSCEEIDAAILDACYTRELIFDDFFQKIFDRDALHFADDAQEAVFFNELEERWEELTGNYDRAGDEPKAELRGHLLELASERRSRLEEWAALSADLSKAPEKEWKHLSEIAVYSNELFRLLNDLAAELPEKEQRRLEDAIDHMEDIQDAALDAVSEALHL